MHSMSGLSLRPFLNRRIRRFSARDVVTVSERELSEREHEAPQGAAEVIWGKVENYYGLGLHPAIALCIRHRGKVILDRAIGHARGNSPGSPSDASLQLATPDTNYSIFSASKSVTAVLILILLERGELSLEDRVADYIPGFEKHGKGDIRIRHLLNHRAGLSRTPAHCVDISLLPQWDRVIEELCDLKPESAAGEILAYHALTGGFLLAEVIQRITGLSLREFLHQEVRRPLGFKTFTYGVDEKELDSAAVDAATGPKTPKPMDAILQRSLGVGLEGLGRIANDPLYRTSVVPSGNIFSTPDEACRFFELLRQGGELEGVRILRRETVDMACQAQSYREIDRVIHIPMRYGLGFMLGDTPFSLYGTKTPKAFGHLGFSQILIWSDPERELSAAFLNTGKPLFTPEFLVWRDVLNTIAKVIPRSRQIR
jgi:CubicO group peptidase (beta-lactamase class C family)